MRFDIGTYNRRSTAQESTPCDQVNRKHSSVVSRENVGKLLVWIMKWGWTTDRAMRSLLQIQRWPGGEYCKRAILEKVVSPKGYGTAYVINQASLVKAYSFYNESPKRNYYLPYPWPKKDIPFTTQSIHQEKAQLIAIDELNKRGGVLETARELNTGNEVSLPDFQISFPDGRVEWHEVELVPKYNEKLFRQLQGRNQSLQQGLFTKIVWWCESEMVALHLKTAMSAHSLPQTVVRGDFKVVRAPGLKGWSPKELLLKSEFLVIGDDRDCPREIVVLNPRSLSQRNNENIETIEDL